MAPVGVRAGMHRAIPILALLALAALLAPPAQAQLGGGPEQIHLAYGADAATSVTVAWVGPVVAPGGARVEYGVDAGFGSKAEAATPIPLPGATHVAYRATLSGLTPATTYTYRVVTGQTSEAFTFTTAPIGDAPFVVAAWGDHGTTDPAAVTGTKKAPGENVALAMNLTPDFHIAAGDLSYSNGEPSVWDAYFRMMQPYASGVPYMTAVGNHEREPGQGFHQYDARLAMPSKPGERWYAFRYANAVFVSLDTEHACVMTPVEDRLPGSLPTRCQTGPNPEQRGFLESTLKAARADATVRWVVVFHHYPIWSDARHGSNIAVRNLWAPLYDEYKVDVVVQGHDHVYERTKPLVGTTVSAVGTTYVTAGTGGISHYKFKSDTPPEWEAARNEEDFGLLLMSFDNDTLVGEFHTLAGEVKDRFTLVKDASGGSGLAPDGAASPTPDATPTPKATPGPALLAGIVVATLAAAAARRRA